MPDWFEPTVLLFPYAAWLFVGLGVPWALVVLPRAHWSERITVLAVGMALGPVIYTTWLFVLGTAGQLTLGPSVAGGGALTALGAVLAARRLRTPPERVPAQPARATKLPAAPRSWTARVLVGGIVLLIVLNVVITAYWPFIAYDTQWVYGYNARVFVLQERIPGDMGYYPQLIPLSYATMQQAWGVLDKSAIDDHAARVVVPWFNTAMVLMAYTLGRRVFHRRRVALLTAAIWAFYPHVAAWSGAGDLEITLALYMTGAVAYFVEAWRTGSARAAMVSGLLFAGAVWTKPTGGALALGMLLAVAGVMATSRLKREVWWPRFRVAAVAGLVSIPVGGMWYLRNWLLGHAPLVFPASYWHDFAQRSGQELGWLLVLAALVAGALLVNARSAEGERSRRRWTLWLPALALVLLLAGTLPTALNLDRISGAARLWDWVRGDMTAARRMNALEWSAVIAGSVLLARAAWDRWRGWPAELRQTVWLLWALLLPYAVVWFLNFSYHYRLSFAIVPLVAVQVAALVDGWLWDWLAARRWGRIAGRFGAVALIAVAGGAAVQHSADAWLDGGLRDDMAKYDAGNPALMVVVHMLERFAAEHGEPVVAIPAEDRLPFFFPEWDIRNSRDADKLPTRLEDLEGVDVFVNTSPGVFLMQLEGLWPNSLQADVAVAEVYHNLSVRGWDGEFWPTVLEPIPLHPDGSLAIDDGNFRYTAFTVHPEARYAPMNPAAQPGGEVIFGDFARFVGHDVITLDWIRGEKVILWLYWQPTELSPPAYDYSIYIHLLDEDNQLIAQWDGVPLQGVYPTRFWRPGESLLDYRVLRVPRDTPLGPARLRIGIYDPLSGERLPVRIDGELGGDGLTINTRITVRDRP